MEVPKDPHQTLAVGHKVSRLAVDRKVFLLPQAVGNPRALCLASDLEVRRPFLAIGHLMVIRQVVDHQAILAPVLDRQAITALVRLNNNLQAVGHLTALRLVLVLHYHLLPLAGVEAVEVAATTLRLASWTCLVAQQALCQTAICSGKLPTSLQCTSTATSSGSNFRTYHPQQPPNVAGISRHQPL